MYLRARQLSAQQGQRTHMLSSSGPLTLKKLSEQDVATALAKSVLPVPGGP